MSNDETMKSDPLLLADELPGPLSLNRLAGLGAIRKLDVGTAFRADDALTLYGRAMIVAKVVPFATVACALTAVWVWLGGEFPDSIDVISSSHYRAPIHGRKVRVFNRKAPPAHLSQLGPLRVTSPARTACDLALLPLEELSRQRAGEIICSLMETHHFRPSDCLDILEHNRYWQNAPRAKAFFEYIRHCL